MGLASLAFFHLLAHALFKSLLFMAMGDVITNLGHGQDSRWLSSGTTLTPSSRTTILVSVLNLLGAPRITGFFSKDLVLETGGFRHGRTLLLLIVYINVFFTYFYTYQLVVFIFSSNKLPPYLNQHIPPLAHRILLGILAIVSVVAGIFYLKAILGLAVGLVVPTTLKFLPLALNFMVGLLLLIRLTQIPKPIQANTLFFGGIVGLTYVWGRIISKILRQLTFNLVRNIEYGIINRSVNITLRKVIGISAQSLKIQSMQTALGGLLIGLFFLIITL